MKDDECFFVHFEKRPWKQAATQTGLWSPFQLESVEQSPERQHIPVAWNLINTLNTFWYNNDQKINKNRWNISEPKQQGSASWCSAPCSTVTATVLVRFSWNLVCGYLHELLGLGLQISVLRHQLLVKMTVEKTVKTGSDVNPKTKCRFWLISTRWTWIYAYLVNLTKTDR